MLFFKRGSVLITIFCIIYPETLTNYFVLKPQLSKGSLKICKIITYVDEHFILYEKKPFKTCQFMYVSICTEKTKLFNFLSIL